MNRTEKIFFNIKFYYLELLIFLFPFFFLTTTQEFFSTNKLYLVAFSSLFLVIIAVLEIFFTKEIVWRKFFFDNILILLVVSVATSTVISSPNKIQALLNPNFGLVALLSLTVLYFFLSGQKTKFLTSGFIKMSSLILSLSTIFFFLIPFQNLNLPQAISFLKTNAFTPIGDRIDLAIYLGFFVIIELGALLKKAEKPDYMNLILWGINFSAFALTTYSLVKSPIQLPPLKLSVLAAIQVLKNPLTLFFGAGIDNFSSVFTMVKDIAYNQSPLWQISSFTVSRSTFLHILSEGGIMSLFSFGLLLFALVNYGFFISKNTRVRLAVIYLLFVILFFPPSIIIWFILYLFLSDINKSQPSNTARADLSELAPVYFGLGFFSFLAVFIAGYFLARSYVAEYFFKQGLNGVLKNSTKDVYENQRSAIIYNPFVEKFRINFSQVNLLIANNIAQKYSNSKSKIPEQDRQNIAQGIQTAISEAKAAVALNPKKAANWGNLAAIYRNIVTIAKGADLWTISSYQRALAADPKNPNYQLGLGGIYYALGNWDEAAKIFEQTIILKPDWPNVYYNLAWTSYQKKDYAKAIVYMQNTIKLINPNVDKIDYEKAKNDLQIFKLKLADQANPQSQSTPQLNLPKPIPTDSSSKIELPKNASPEVK